MGVFLLLGYEIDLEPVIRGLLVQMLALLSDRNQGVIRKRLPLFGNDIKQWNL